MNTEAPLSNAQWHCSGEYPSGTLGQTLTWELKPDGLLYIGGTGNMPYFTQEKTGMDYEYYNPIYGTDAPWYQYRPYISSVVINEGVTSIGSNAFAFLNHVKSVSLPSSIRILGSYAFCDCSELTDIVIPDNVTAIDSAAFKGCKTLTDVAIPQNATTIGSEAFYGCTSLGSVELPLLLTSVEDSTFYNCSALNHVTIPDGVTYINYNAFFNCSSLQSLLIPETVTTIGEYAFSNCTSLSEITIPGSVREWSYSVFSGCTSLRSVTISPGVTYIGGYNFSGCSALTSISIPLSVQSIDYGAFQQCSSLTSIMIPESIEVIHGEAFKDCTALTEITVPGSVQRWYESTFENCTALKDVTIRNGVSSLPESAFSGCTSMKTITIPGSVTQIGTNAFYGCTLLDTVRFEGNIPSIASNAFTSIVATVYYPFANSTYTPAKKTNYGGALTWVPYGTITTEDGIICEIMPDGVNFAITGHTDTVPAILLIPDSLDTFPVSVIGSKAFSGCDTLTSITIPATITSIAADAFETCSAMTRVNFCGTQEQWEALGGNDLVPGATVVFDVFENYFKCVAAGTQDTTARIGVSYNETATLKVTASGMDLAGVTYQWFDNAGNAISGATADNYTTPAVKSETGYTCTAADGYGATATVTFTVYNTTTPEGYTRLITDTPVTVYVGSGKTVYLAFTPETNGTYVFASTSDKDTCGVLCNSSKERILSDDDSGENNNFQIRYSLTAGITYLLGVSWYEPDLGGNMPVFVSQSFTAYAMDTNKTETDVTLSPNTSTSLFVSVAPEGTNVGYRWYQVVLNENGSWDSTTLIEGADTDKYTIPPVTEYSMYICCVSDSVSSQEVRFTINVDNDFTAYLINQTNDYGQISVPKGNTITLQVAASARDGELKYSWHHYVDDETGWERLEGEAGSSYTTAKITGAEQYYCMVRDGYGNTQQVWVEIVVENGLTAVVTGTNRTWAEKHVKYGTNTVLSVTASANQGNITYEWYIYDKNKEWDPWISIPGAYGSSYTTDAIRDFSSYRCNVSDEYGTRVDVSFDVYVENDLIAYVEGTTQDWADRTIALDATTQMRVKATATSGELSYQWYIIRDPNGSWDWEEIPGATNASCTSEPAERYTVYVCEVTDKYGGKANVWFNIYVDAPSSFTVRPVGETRRTVNVGDDLTLAVEVTGDGVFTYEWREIRGIWGEGWYAGSSTDSLVFRDIQKSGEYVCFVYDQYGNEKRADFYVTVANDFRVTAPVEGNPWAEVYTDVTPGTSVPLSVSAVADSGSITYSWYLFSRDNWEYIELKSGADSSYTVPSVSNSDDYYCRVTDQYGTVITVVFECYIDNQLAAYASGTTDSWLWTSVAAGKKTTLSVTASAARGTLSYRWFKRTYNSSGEYGVLEQVSGADNKTKITTAAINMFTEYWCEVSDMYGNTKTVVFYINVENDLSAYVAGTKDTWKLSYVSDGATSTLSVDAFASSGKLNFKWFEFEINENGNWTNSKEIPGATTKTFTTPAISGYRDRDLVYRCQVIDKYGNWTWVYFDFRNADIAMYSNGQALSDSLGMIAGKAQTLTVKTMDDAVVKNPDWTVTGGWSAKEGQAVVSIDSKGSLKANYVGEAQLTATYGGFSQSVWITVLFSDVTRNSDYYYDPVYWAARNGITTGTSASTFSPSASCTRGQIVTFLWRACGSPEPTNAYNPFKDVKPGAFYYDAVLWAVENDITTGTSATTFAPNDPCTRKQIVTFLWRANGSPRPTSSANPFTDVKNSDYFYDAVLWAVENGITTGTSATTFAPNAKCSRGQCVTFLMRAVA